MCGIAGIARFAGPTGPEDVAAVLRMMDAQMHRGPDDWGLLLSEGALRNPEARAVLERRGTDHVRTYTASAPAVVLGSRRLSIIDLSPRGRMPMGSADGRVWITYNGEIYNSRDLREELEHLGYSFQSDTDTETILHGYEEWGEKVVQRLHGMFAFAILDTTESPRLLLARDRFGIKPLYYYKDGDAVIFASEVRALMRSELVPHERSHQALVRFLQLGSVPQPLTTVKDVLALPRAHSLSIDQDSSRLRQYWDLSSHLQASAAAPTDFSDCVSRARSLLEESVRLHLISDAPLGVFLSGGVDSSALVALASRSLNKPVTTVSIAFEEAAFNEAPYARLVAKQYRTDHREILVQSKDFFDAIPDIFAAMDQPTIDGVNSYFVSKAAKQAGLTVVLSGTGGDEVFLGYGHLRKAKSIEGALHFFGRLPVWMRKGLIQAAKQAWALRGKSGWEKLTYFETPSDVNTYLRFRGLFAPKQIQRLLGISEKELTSFDFTTQSPNLPVSQSTGSPISQSPNLLQSFTLFEFNHYLQNQLLKDTDFMSMAHSIETRVPFLDHRLVEYIAGIPAGLKLDHGMNKPLLVKAMGESFPRKIWDRPKTGFAFPFGEWMRKHANDLKARSREQKSLEQTAVAEVFKKFQEGRVHWSQPWALVVASEWSSG